MILSELLIKKELIYFLIMIGYNQKVSIMIFEKMLEEFAF